MKHKTKLTMDLLTSIALLIFVLIAMAYSIYMIVKLETIKNQYTETSYEASLNIDFDKNLMEDFSEEIIECYI